MLLLMSLLGLTLINTSQDRIATTSTQIRQVLLPAGRLFEEAKGELDLQSQELALLSGSKGKSVIELQDLGLLRLGPAVKSLVQLHESPLVPHVVRPLMDPWIKSVQEYNEQLTSIHDLSDAIARLKTLRQKTHLLQRAIDRELSLQLLRLSESIHESAGWWSAALVVTLLSMLAFVGLLWKWMAPLEKMQEWLMHYRKIDGESSFLAAPPPPSVLGTGPLSPPSEVQDLVEALRFHLQTFKDLAKELKIKSEKNAETERAIGTLFAGFQYLLRNNQALLDELIQKEKLASMGEMAAQLAHEIRNPLNSLNLKIELLREDVGPAQQRQIDKVIGEIDRLNALTESHLLATRQHVFQKSPHVIEKTKPFDVIHSTCDLFAPTFAEKHVTLQIEDMSPHAELEINLPPELLKACLINLLKNALEACEESSVPAQKIKICCGQTAERVQITVLDTGVGFTEAWMERPFQLFHSAKKSGTGLGLHSSLKSLAPFGFSIHVNQDLTSGFNTSVSLSGPCLNGTDNRQIVTRLALENSI